MKNFVLAMLLLFATSTLFAQIKTDTLVSDCKLFVQAKDNGKNTYDNNEQEQGYNRCVGYVAGYMDESAGELMQDKEHKTLSVGNWEGVTADQEIRVFLKYVQANPEALNKNAVFVLWYSALQAGLYTYKPVPVTVSNN